MRRPLRAGRRWCACWAVGVFVGEYLRGIPQPVFRILVVPLRRVVAANNGCDSFGLDSAGPLCNSFLAAFSDAVHCRS